MISKLACHYNQITVVAFQSVQLAQDSVLQKNQTLQNVFLISVTLRWHRVSVACKNQSFKLVYFWTKSRKYIYGCFFHSFCATDLKFGTKNIRSMKLSILKTLIFASYWDSCLLSVTDIKKRFFCKNEACVNCGKETARTLTWLLTVQRSVSFILTF